MKPQHPFLRRATSLFFVAVLGCAASPPPVDPALLAPATIQPGPPPAPPVVVDTTKDWSDSDARVPVTSANPVWGDRGAPVTLVEFADFQCPYCGRFAATLQKLKEEYGPARLRIAWKHYPLPFHQNAKPASEAAQGVFALAGNDAFWRFYEAAFSNQAQLGPESYEDWAMKAGVGDLGAFRQGLGDHQWATKVDLDTAVGNTVGVRGTPTSFVNGVLVNGAQPYDEIKKIVDEELAKAQAKLASGTPADRIYVTRTAENFTATPVEDKVPQVDRTVYKVPATGPARGGSAPLVTIVEFADFQCPFCAKVEPTLKALMAKYGGDLRIVWKDLPLSFHPRATPAANLAIEARKAKGDTGFWDAHDRLFAAQPNLDDAALDGIAQAMGLNVATVHAAIQANKHQAALQADEDVAEDFNASGTPHFFINGRRLVGAQPESEFSKVIDEELVKARALVAAGTAAADVYDALTKTGNGPAGLERKSVAAASPRAPFKGNARAKVVVQVFSDFQCPFCQRAESTLDKVMQTYGTRIKLVWRNLPLAMHADARTAAEAALEAYKQGGSTAFWKIHDLMFQNRSDLSRPTLDGYAAQLHLDMNKWAAALDQASHETQIAADEKAANDAGIHGTPAFLIGPYYISGAQPFSKFRRAIERALAEAGP